MKDWHKVKFTYLESGIDASPIPKNQFFLENTQQNIIIVVPGSLILTKNEK